MSASDSFSTAIARRSRRSLRAGDALHLAIATNRSAEALYSLDRKLIEAGRRLGVPAVGLSQPPDGR